MELLKVVRGKEGPLAPVIAQPAHVRLDGRDELQVLLEGVGVIETQIAMTRIVQRQAKIQDDGLGMTNVQIAIGLRREAREDTRMFTTGQILLDDLANEIGFPRGGQGGVLGIGHRIGITKTKGGPSASTKISRLEGYLDSGIDSHLFDFIGSLGYSGS